MATRSKGDGSVYQRADGKWIGTVEAGWRDGKRKRRTVSGPTRAVVVAKMRKLRQEVDAGVLAENITVEKWLTYWLDEVCPSRELKPSTMYNYRNYVKTWAVPTLGKLELRKLKPEHVRRLHRTMEDAGKSPATIRQMHAILSRALKIAEQEGRVIRNVAALVDVPSGEGEPHPSLTEDQGRLLLATATTERELARLTCAIVLGLRQGEALGLQWSDVDLELGMMRIHEALHNVPGTGGPALGSVKSKASKRAFRLPVGVVAILAAWRAKAGPGPWVFPNSKGGPLDKRKDSRDWSGSLERAGLRHVPLHGARASAASQLAATGMPDRAIADILGHRDVSTTRRHYIRAEESQLTAALDGAAAAMLPPPSKKPPAQA